VRSQDDSATALARRLRELRTGRWADRKITQGQLAEAFGASVPLVSSWESRRSPVTPPENRLDAYATFFATERSVAGEPYRVLRDADLTEEEQRVRRELYDELTRLTSARADRGTFCFSDGAPITIVVAELPLEMRATPRADVHSPDHVELYTYADVDALFEVHGHVRAMNPDSPVHVRTPRLMIPDDYTTHLVLLGGTDGNDVTRDLLDRLGLSVTQVERPDESHAGGFRVNGRVVEPVVRTENGHRVLVEDVAQFHRAPNPFNLERAVVLCNGTYGRGTLGAVRALTDERFRDRNEEHLRRRFAGHDAFGLLTRIAVVNGQVVTPDWTGDGTLLHEWPSGGAARRS
jgi:transcriptional regulator with XRE-family HTH domain